MTDGDGRGLIGGMVSDVTAGLKNNPSCLAAILLAGVFAWLTFTALQRDQERQQARFQAIFDACFTTDGPKRNPPLP